MLWFVEVSNNPTVAAYCGAYAAETKVQQESTSQMQVHVQVCSPQGNCYVKLTSVQQTSVLLWNSAVFLLTHCHWCLPTVSAQVVALLEYRGHLVDYLKTQVQPIAATSIVLMGSLLTS